MKVVNTVKLKEEFDYERLCRKLETQVDHLSAEVDRQQKLKENETNELKKLVEEFENSYAEAQKNFSVRSEVFISKLHLVLHELSVCILLSYHHQMSQYVKRYSTSVFPFISCFSSIHRGCSY